LRFEADAISDAKLQHGFMGTHLVHQSEALYNPMVQVYKFSFGEMVYVDPIHVLFTENGNLCEPE